MSGWLILTFLILSSSIPAIAVFLWFRIARYPFSSIRFLLVLLTGAAAYFPALVFQRLFPPDFYIAGRIGLLAQMFLPIAFTEELSRLIALLIFFCIVRRIDAGPRASGSAIPGAEQAIHPAGDSAPPTTASAPTGYETVIYGTAAGLVAGFGFAILESAAYGAANPEAPLLRLFTAALIHGTCGARVGSAAILFRTRPVQGFFRFLPAVVIHGIYNSMIVMPGFAPFAAVLIAFFSLTATILTIRSGMNPAKKQTTPC